MGACVQSGHCVGGGDDDNDDDGDGNEYSEPAIYRSNRGAIMKWHRTLSKTLIY